MSVSNIISLHRRMNHLILVSLLLGLLPLVIRNPITYKYVQDKPYNVFYDHRAITINGVRTMLISGVINYPRSTSASMQLF